MGAGVENVVQGLTTVIVTAGLSSLDFIPLEMGLVDGRILAETNSRVSFHLS